MFFIRRQEGRNLAGVEILSLAIKIKFISTHGVFDSMKSLMTRSRNSKDKCPQSPNYSFLTSRKHPKTEKQICDLFLTLKMNIYSEFAFKPKISHTLGSKSNTALRKLVPAAAPGPRGTLVTDGSGCVTSAEPRGSKWSF